MKHALNITREENFPEWYQEVVAKADLAENSNTRGAMVIKPYGYAIWENIKNALDKKIKEHGVQNACFPALIPVELMEREAEHVSGLAKECVVLTHHRLIEKDGELFFGMFNFSRDAQTAWMNEDGDFTDLFTGMNVDLHDPILPPRGLYWVKRG